MLRFVRIERATLSTCESFIMVIASLTYSLAEPLSASDHEGALAYGIACRLGSR